MHVMAFIYRRQQAAIRRHVLLGKAGYGMILHLSVAVAVLSYCAIRKVIYWQKTPSSGYLIGVFQLISNR